MIDLLRMIPGLGWMAAIVGAVLWFVSRTIGLPWIGPITHFGDGDSFESKAWRNTYRVRLRGLDAPEYKQEYGRDARQGLVDLLQGRRVLFVPWGADRNGRLLCWMFCRRGPVAWIMVWRGHAWPQSVATWFIHLIPRMAKRGLWGGTTRIRPSAWRRYYGGTGRGFYVPQSPPQPDRPAKNGKGKGGAGKGYAPGTERRSASGGRR